MEVASAAVPPLHFALKVATRCNLNCHYCYVYNKGDDTWRKRPAVMSQPTFEQALARIAEHCAAARQRTVRLVFHGGEPTLVGPLQLAFYCERVQEVLGEYLTPHLSLQTNGTLIDQAWIEVIRRYELTVGLSIDGPAAIHNATRVDHQGRGSHGATTEAIRLLVASSIPVTLLCVVPLSGEPLALHQYLLSLRPAAIQYILPDYTHDSIGPVRARFATPCFDFLSPIMSEWWSRGKMQVQVEPFREMARIILGGVSRVDYLGNRPLRFFFIESDGEIEGLDVLRVCGNGAARTGFNVADHSFAEVLARHELQRTIVLDGAGLPADCRGCSESETCSGGYLPHRFGSVGGFNHRSVWCEDLLRLFKQLRTLLGITVEETRERRSKLEREDTC